MTMHHTDTGATLRCDGPKCAARVTAKAREGEHFAEAHRRAFDTAEARGWYLPLHGGDLCPRCRRG